MALKNKILILFSVVYLFTVQSCHSQVGEIGTSSNVEESKKRGVFVCEYETSMNPYVINDSMSITIKEAWLEKNWIYAKDINKSNIQKGYSLRINSREEDLKGFPIKWSIDDGVNWKTKNKPDFRLEMRGTNKKNMISGFRDLPPDTIRYIVHTGESYIENNPTILGEFVIFKKK